MLTLSTRTADRKYARFRSSGVPTSAPGLAAGAIAAGAVAAVAAAADAVAAADTAANAPFRCCCAAWVPAGGIPVNRCRISLALESVLALLRVA